jgi:hypothetical protein
MELLRAGLAPFVEREFTSLHQAQAAEVARRYFGKTLGRAERSLVQERRDCRNKWAHQEPFSGDDADRALDSMTRLLTAISAREADDVNMTTKEKRRYAEWKRR